MERRKLISTILLAVAGVIFIASSTFFLVKMPSSKSALLSSLLSIVAQVFILLFMAFTLFRSTISQQRPSYRFNLLQLPHTDPFVIDPGGYRYLSNNIAGFFLIALLAFKVHQEKTFPLLGQALPLLIFILISLSAIVLIITFEVKAAKLQTPAGNNK